MGVREVLGDMEGHRPALEYLARVEKAEQERAVLTGLYAEMFEIQRVLAGDCSEETKDFCRLALADLWLTVIGMLKEQE